MKTLSPQPPVPKQWETLALVPIAGGLFWLWGGDGAWLFWALLPGALLLATGVALLLMPGEQRAPQYMALGGLLGVLLAVPALFTGGFFPALTAALVSAASYVVAGRVALNGEPVTAGIPQPDATPGLAAKAALDEALLAYFVGSAKLPDAPAVERHRLALQQFEAVAASENWAANPERAHREPSAPAQFQVSAARTLGQDYSVVHYDSGFVPDPRLPGAGEWAAQRGNARSVAWVLRHPAPVRTWLLCVHGYRMGLPWLDFGLFRPGWLHHKLGVNLMMPVLPLHGPRRIGWRSGDGYLEGDPALLFHAETQALWDLRRAVQWIRAQDADARIGVLGFSLGGYNTALLAQYQSGLDFVVAGIPAVDLPEAIWRHAAPPHRAYYESQGFTLERFQRAIHPVSPLARTPLLAENARYIFAGTADRVVVPAQPQRLARHWNVPVQWYAGGHLTFRDQRVVRAHIEMAMANAGWDVGPVSVAA